MDSRYIYIIPVIVLIALANSCKFPNAPAAEITLSAPVLSSPENNKTGVSTEPELLWTQSEGATKYNLQLATDSSFSNLVINENGLADTGKQVVGLSRLVRYYWRVSAANNYESSAWSSPAFAFVTAGTIPSVPLLSLPSNGASDINVNPVLTWNASLGADGYTLQVSKSSTFTDFVYNQSGLTATSKQITGLNNFEKYYWRVSASNISGTSDWSSPAWSFTTSHSIPVPPVLSSPADNSVDISTSPNLIWNSSSGATSYTLQVSADPSFSSFIYNQSGIINTNRQVTGLNNLTNYFWRVRAANGSGTSGWSDPVWSFKTKAASLAAPLLSLPTNMAASVSTSPTFVWIASSGAASYTLQISTDNAFSALTFNQSDISTTNIQVTGLNSFTVYYWRVRAVNNLGVSDWSTPSWSFTTGSAPLAPPVLISPSNNSSNVSITPTLSWSASPGAAGYTLQVSTSSSFSDFVFNQSGLTNTSHKLLSLNYLTKYYWRVRAANNSGTSDWSAPTWSFTTAEACEGGTVMYSGKLYHSVQVGSQCWLKENLDVGLLINGNQNQSNNGILEKYCYDNNRVNCEKFGGLYQWDEVMQYVKTPGTKGICPDGWHIPTKAELDILKNSVKGNSNDLKAVGEGTADGAGTNASGFSALLSGFGYSTGNGVGYSYSLGINTFFWSSSEADLSSAHYMNMYFNQSVILNQYDRKASAFSVRCIKD